jgi:hypothetical protein
MLGCSQTLALWALESGAMAVPKNWRSVAPMLYAFFESNGGDYAVMEGIYLQIKRYTDTG